MYINKAILLGNLTRDPELKSLPSGQKMCSFPIATNRSWKEANGEKKEAADYHNIVCFGRQAETVNQWMKKGSQVYVEGRMTTRSWDDKDTGKKMYRTEIIAENIQFGQKKEEGAIEVPPMEFAEVPSKGNNFTSTAPTMMYKNEPLPDYTEEIDPPF